jgi:hypothetical protein
VLYAYLVVEPYRPTDALSVSYVCIPVRLASTSASVSNFRYLEPWAPSRVGSSHAFGMAIKSGETQTAKGRPMSKALQIRLKTVNGAWYGS